MSSVIMFARKHFVFSWKAFFEQLWRVLNACFYIGFGLVLGLVYGMAYFGVSVQFPPVELLQVLFLVALIFAAILELPYSSRRNV